MTIAASNGRGLISRGIGPANMQSSIGVTVVMVVLYKSI
jgi:hypothetical protein